MQSKGFILAAAAGVAWGTIPLTVKLIYSIGSASPLEISFFRFLIAFAVILPVMRMKKEHFLVNKWSILMGFSGVFWMSYISFYGIQYTSAVNATILFNSNPLFVAVLSLLLKWEKLSFSSVAGILLGISGVVLVSGLRGIDFYVWGDLLVLLGAFGWAVYTVLGYKLRETSSLSVTASSLLWGLVWFGSIIWREVPVSITGPAWMWIVYIGLIPTACAFVFYIKAVDLIGSTRASVFQYLAPAVAVVLSFVFHLEDVTVYQIVGIILIVIGIELTRRSRAF